MRLTPRTRRRLGQGLLMVAGLVNVLPGAGAASPAYGVDIAVALLVLSAGAVLLRSGARRAGGCV